MATQPTAQFWDAGQSFLIFAPSETWPAIIGQAGKQWHVSPFDLVTAGANTMGVVEARALQQECYKGPAQGPIKLCVVEQMDKASDEAANTLLKILEEMPPKSKFVLLSETRDVLATIRSRCLTWIAPALASGASDMLVPLEKNALFGTVSLDLERLVKAGRSLEIIDQWTRVLIQQAGAASSVLHWLITIRQAVGATAINQQALLEVTYLHIVHHYPLPPSLDIFYNREPHGHI